MLAKQKIFDKLFERESEKVSFGKLATEKCTSWEEGLRLMMLIAKTASCRRNDMKPVKWGL